MTLLPPLPAIGTVRLELFGPGPAAARWDAATWGEDVWGRADWQDVTPQSLNAKSSWGADDGARGVLSVAAAGTWNVRTYDPDRLLDPANPASQFSSVLHPGGKVRIRYVGSVARTVKAGVIDEIAYDLDTETGSIRATDGISALQAVEIPAATGGAPGTLRARARWLLAIAAIPDIVVEPDPAEGDPIVGPAPTEAATVWDWLNTAGLDVLHACWLGSDYHAPVINGSFEDALTGWTTVGAVTQSAGGTSGAYALRIVGDGVTVNPLAKQLVNVHPGYTYKLTAMARADSGLVARLRASGYDASGVSLGTIATWDTAETGYILAGGSFVAPAGTAQVEILMYIPGTPGAGLAVNFDAVNLVPAVLVDNVIKFRSFGDPRDLGLEVGGIDGLPIDNVTPQTSLVGIVSKVIGYDTTAPSTPIAKINTATEDLVGKAYFERTRPVPNANAWVTNALQDLSGAALQYALGTIRPRTEAEFLGLLDAGMVDVAHIAVTHRNQGREELAVPIVAAPRILGGTFQADTQTGWTAGLATYVTAAEWSDAAVTPPEPPIPPPTSQTVVRTYLCQKDSRAYNAGSNLGSGTEGELPVGIWSGAKNRAFLGFTAIPWGDVLEIVDARLRIYTSTQVNIGFGSSPKVRVQRVTANWSEGTASSPSGSNALVYPGPTRTSTGERVATITGSENVLADFSILAIVKAWAPTAIGGNNAKQYGIGIISYGESSQAYTTEFWAREHGSGTRPEIRLTVKIPA